MSKNWIKGAVTKKSKKERKSAGSFMSAHKGGNKRHLTSLAKLLKQIRGGK